MEPVGVRLFFRPNWRAAIVTRAVLLPGTPIVSPKANTIGSGPPTPVVSSRCLFPSILVPTRRSLFVVAGTTAIVHDDDFGVGWARI